MGESFASWLLAIGERESRKSHFGWKKDASNSIKHSETLKYSVKPSDLALERDKGAWLHEMTKQVHKMRFIATGGVLKGILKPEDEITTEEMISSSEEVQDVGESRVAFQFKPEYRKYVYAPKYNEYAD